MKTVNELQMPPARTIAVALGVTLGLLLSAELARAETDVSANWSKHVIGAGVVRDHGHSTAAGDLNGDGRVDGLIAYGRRFDQRPEDGLWWYQAPADPRSGTWTKRRLSDPAKPIRWTWSTALGDVDNDGDLDVVASPFDDSYVYLCINPRNQPNGATRVNEPWLTLRIEGSGGTGRYGERIEIVDIDGDDYADILFLKGSPKKAYALFNPRLNPDDPTASWLRKELGDHAGSDSHDIIAADFDRDGDLDVAVASGDGDNTGAVYWFEHPDGTPRTGQWTRRKVNQASSNYGGVHVDDVDGDGWPDILVAKAHLHPGDVIWYENPQRPQNASSWARHVMGRQTYPHAAALIDVDGDGVNEYWVPDASNGCDQVDFCWNDGGVVYFKRGADPRQPWEKNVVRTGPEVGRQSRTLDVDGDGDLDVISTADHRCVDRYYSCTLSLVWWENRTPGVSPPSDPPPAPQLTLSPTALSFSGKQGETNPGTQSVTVRYLDGAAPGTRSPEISYAGSAADWLTVEMSASASTHTLINAVSLAGLSPNTYSATVKVFADRAANSPQTYVVALRVSKAAVEPDAGVGDASVQPTMTLEPTQIGFSATARQAAPASQQVLLATDSAANVTLEDVRTAIGYAGEGGWLEATVESNGNTFAITNEVDQTGLTPNRYVATVSVSANGLDNSPQSYVVLLDVSASPQPDVALDDASWPDAGWDTPDAGLGGEAGSAAPRMQLDERTKVLSGGCEIGAESNAVSTALLLALALALALRRRPRHRLRETRGRSS